MRKDDLLARLEMLGVKYECVHARINGVETELRYLSRDGKHTPIDLGDLSRATRTTLERIAKALGLTMEELTGLLN